MQEVDRDRFATVFEEWGSCTKMACHAVLQTTCMCTYNPVELADCALPTTVLCQPSRCTRLADCPHDAADIAKNAPNVDLRRINIVSVHTGVRTGLAQRRRPHLSDADITSWPMETSAVIIQTAPSGTPRLAIMMYEHNALCLQFAHAFGNEQFEPLSPTDLMIHVISHHDAGWIDFDRNPKIDPATGLPYNLVDTPPEFITTTSRLSPDFNQRQHPYCGLISSMHSWGLYNGRYGLSKLVLLDKIAAKDRPLADKMLNGELERQKRLKAELATDPETRAWLDERKIFQNYKALQFLDTLALYFNRIHPSERVEQAFENVPLSREQDATVTIRPAGANTYHLSPFPFAADGAEFAFCGRRVSPADGNRPGGWPAALKKFRPNGSISGLAAG